MSDEILTNMELTILEIVSQHRDIHFLNILAQVKQMATLTTQTFDKKLFDESLANLEKKECIKRHVTNPETFGITEKGKDLL